MSVMMRDLVFRGSANMPDGPDPTGTTGGAVDWTKKISFVDITPNGFMDVVSSAAGDTNVIVTVSGRDATGVIQAPALTTNGTTVVTGSQTFERLLKGALTGTTAVGDVAAISHTAVISGTAAGGAAGTGTTDAFITLADATNVAIGDVIRITNNLPAGVQFQLREIIAISGVTAYVNADFAAAPTSSTTYTIHQGFLFNLSYGTGASNTSYQVTQVRRVFYNAASDVVGGSTRNYYEKFFLANINTATALTLASVLKQTDPSAGTINFALTNALNDTGTVATRQTAPVSGITAFSSGAAPQTIAIPAPQNLPSGAAPNAAGAQGIWGNLVLTAGLAPTKTSFTMRGTGQTT